jgi:CRISPR-associated protein Cas2
MRAEEARRDEVKAWLARAVDDLRAAAHNLSATPPLLADALFHAQQAVESYSTHVGPSAPRQARGVVSHVEPPRTGPAPRVLKPSLKSSPVAPDNRTMRKTYLVCYDICDDRRLHKVHKTMRAFGDRLQYSVFECQMTPVDLSRCRHRLSGIIDHKVDQVIFVDLGPAEGRGDRVITALGKPYAPFDSPCIVVDGLEEVT